MFGLFLQLFLGALSLVLAAGVGTSVAAYIARTLALARLTPRRALAKIAGSCTFSQGLSMPSSGSPAPTLGAGPVHGTIPGSSIIQPPGVTTNVDGDVVLLAHGDITIGGAFQAILGISSMTMISLRGNIRITPGGKVRGGKIASGPATRGALFRLAAAGPGQPGGVIRLLAPRGSIDVEGRVEGQDGGDGGKADDDGFSVIPLPTGAAGGQSGAGGEVWLCALESIHIGINGVVRGGEAGKGGAARAKSMRLGDSLAVHGPGNSGGDVHLNGPNPSALTQVFFEQGGVVEGGHGAGRSRRPAAAIAGNGLRSNGRYANAIGGNGGDGGTVLFSGCVVNGPFTVRPGMGGDGAWAVATGGFGDDAILLSGFAGGGANAVGGDGGAPGAPVAVPTAAGTTVPGQPPVPGPGHTSTGGSATVITGGGGSGGLAGNGGPSGTGTAQGGRGGISKTLSAPVRVAPVAATGTPGALRGSGTSIGVP